MSKTITFPRSDGNSERWPAGWLPNEVDIKSNTNYHEKVREGHSKYELFLVKIGQHLAESKGLPNPQSYRLSDLPAGYALFLHHKQQKDGSDRTDIYMFGSKHVLKFRSPAEMFGHAEWLMNEDLNIDNHKLCTCKYSSNYAAPPAIDNSERKRKIAKDDEGNKSGGGAAAKKSKPAPKTLEQRHAEYKADMLSASKERKGELRSRSFGRRGEVVWCRLPTVNAPEGSARETKTVTFWPGLITMVQTKVTATPGVGNAPYTIRHSYVYDIKLTGQLDADALVPSGMVEPVRQIKLDEADVLPWHIFDLESIKAPIVRDVTEIGREWVESNAPGDDHMVVDDDGKTKVAPWLKTLARRFKISEMGVAGNWDMLIVNYGWALKFAEDAANSWCQTNAYANSDSLRDPTLQISQEERDELAGKRRTFFQGMHWAGERIWMEDLVRLRKRRDELPTAGDSDDPAGGLPDPSPGASDRGVFLKLRAIAVDEPSSTAAPADRSYDCRIQGDLYELATIEWDRANPVKDPSSVLPGGKKGVKPRQDADGMIGVEVTLASAAAAQAGTGMGVAGPGPSTSAATGNSGAGSGETGLDADVDRDIGGKGDFSNWLPEPPSGYVFRRLNPGDSEVTCDVFDISGRYYPPSFPRHPLITSQPPNTTIIAPTTISRLTGLSPGSTSMPIESTKWRQNKYVSLLHAHETSLRWLSGFFEDKRDMDAKVDSVRVVPVADKMELTAAWVNTA